ncbi:MAG: SxtJ family membrane protein [Cyclobacteriaceae bacterium]|nr:SxtJ family membrane protein [Cyclobacteriaceae bacterium]
MNNFKKNRQFGLIIGTVLLLILIYNQIVLSSTRVIFLMGGLILIVVALLAPNVLNPLRIFWDFIGKYLGLINSVILLTLIYFFIITPMAIILRILKHDPMKRGFDKESTTYWIDRKVNDSSTSMINQF